MLASVWDPTGPPPARGTQRGRLPGESEARPPEKWSSNQLHTCGEAPEVLAGSIENSSGFVRAALPSEEEEEALNARVRV